MRMVKTPKWPADRFEALLDRILDETGQNKAQLAGLLGINPSQIGRWMSGSTRPRVETLQALGAALAARFPELGVGFKELATAAGYLDEEAEPSTPSPPQPPQGAAEPSPVDLDRLEEYVPQTSVERVLLELLQAQQREREEMRRKLDTIDEKLDRLTGDEEEGGQRSA